MNKTIILNEIQKDLILNETLKQWDNIDDIIIKSLIKVIYYGKLSIFDLEFEDEILLTNYEINFINELLEEIKKLGDDENE